MPAESTSQPWSTLTTSALDSLWKTVSTNKTASASIKAVASTSALNSTGTLDDLWAAAFAGQTHVAKVVTEATSATAAAASTAAEIKRQGRATLKYAVV